MFSYDLNTHYISLEGTFRVLPQARFNTTSDGRHTQLHCWPGMTAHLETNSTVLYNIAIQT